MDRSGASAFVYAKASGMLAKSFIGQRTAKLFEARKLSDLWALLFDEDVPLVPEFMLARQIEEKAEKDFISDFSRLLSCYKKPDAVLIKLLSLYDYTNLKLLSASLYKNAKEIPVITDIGVYSELNYSAWPDLQKITMDSSMSWYNDVPEISQQKDWDHKLDVQYVRQLWNAVQKLPRNERRPVEKLIKEDLVLQNIIWALRLRVYYSMDDQEIKSYLAGISDNPEVSDLLAGPAINILDKAVDSYSDWENWEFKRLLNHHEPDSVWVLDPRWVQQSANIVIAKNALKAFHKYPFTAMVLVTWFKLKQNEVNNIRTAAEALRLNINENEVKEFTGVR